LGNVIKVEHLKVICIIVSSVTF